MKLKFCEVQVVLSNGACLLRLLPHNSDCLTIQATATAACNKVQLHLAEDLTIVAVHQNDVVRRPLESRAPSYTNICGRVLHKKHMQSVWPAMRVLFKPIINEFGQLLQISHIDANLVTSMNRTTTLFRGGRSFARIQDLLHEVLDFSQVYGVSLHMCVCAAQLQYPVRIAAGKNCLLDEVFLQDPSLSARIDYSNEEMSAVKVIHINHIEAGLLLALTTSKIQSLRQLLIHVGNFGFVNMILVVEDDIPFAADLGACLMPLFQYFYEKIEAVT